MTDIYMYPMSISGWVKEQLNNRIKLPEHKPGDMITDPYRAYKLPYSRFNFSKPFIFNYDDDSLYTVI
jgi:PhoPQ-activated pathogenicity-related protein